ncbi:hypothetical protein IMPR6_480020 [Imperialibacter sp. EC-SDR9]|nr:hypothetical protein IMPERIA89_420020 [Imperialibacter sp. 89]CAD5295224.1 hypothetical protein IMPERIA75_690020 [Imperialibacter sp. 75]VVT29145.1 hypothetical protein IMPR6_480020 [Imperialibacter sp. EC-SDR9]
MIVLKARQPEVPGVSQTFKGLEEAFHQSG